MRLIVIFLTIICIINNGLALRNFMRGRRFGGNIGEPILLKNKDLPQQQWFTQYLDHFNPTEARTWKQVFYKYLQIYLSFNI